MRLGFNDQDCPSDSLHNKGAYLGMDLVSCLTKHGRILVSISLMSHNILSLVIFSKHDILDEISMKQMAICLPTWNPPPASYHDKPCNLPRLSGAQMLVIVSRSNKAARSVGQSEPRPQSSNRHMIRYVMPACGKQTMLGLVRKACTDPARGASLSDKDKVDNLYDGRGGCVCVCMIEGRADWPIGDLQQACPEAALRDLQGRQKLTKPPVIQPNAQQTSAPCFFASSGGH
jgi:hypothetical protein